jgi:hypothetical protein
MKRHDEPVGNDYCIKLGKVATSATLLMVNEITGNKNGNKNGNNAATDRQHSFRVEAGGNGRRGFDPVPAHDLGQ